jgi:CheY-like chemotaxis protein
MKVVAVDDDKVNRVLLGAFLHHIQDVIGINFMYEVAESGLEAIQMCEKEPIGLVFMDIMMPQMNGLEAIGAIRKVYEHKKWEEPMFVMVTACDGKEMAINARNAGAVGYLMKPVDKNELID